MIQFDTPATLDGRIIIEALLDAGILVAATDDHAAYKSVVPPYIDGDGNFWLAVPENQAIQTQQILDNLSA